jgi:hypothetical protein
MIHSGTSELRRAFRAHRAAADKSVPSHYLLRFYAAECGLKLSLMLRKRIQKTDRLVDGDFFGHDLMRLARELRVKPALLLRRDHFLMRNGYRQSLSSAHEAWRYGVALDEKEELDLVDWIDSVCDWIDQEVTA